MRLCPAERKTSESMLDHVGACRGLPLPSGCCHAEALMRYRAWDGLAPMVPHVALSCGQSDHGADIPVITANASNMPANRTGLR